MAYFNTAAIVRQDINQVVEEARAQNEDFIGMTLFPPVGEPVIAGTYKRLRRKENKMSHVITPASLKRAEKTEFKEIESSWTTDSFLCEEYGLLEKIGDATQKYLAPSFDVETKAAKRVAMFLMRGHELRASDVINNPSVWGTAATPAVNYTYTLIATVNFVLDIKRALAKLRRRGENPNTIVMSYELWDLIQQSTQVRQYLFGVNSGSASVTKDEVAKKLEIDKIIVAAASYTTAGENDDVDDTNSAFMWPNTYIWVGEIKGGKYEDGGCGRSIHWTKMAPTFFVNETYREEPIMADVVRTREYDVIKVINPNCGTLITTNYSAS